jgi:hypothetical protein
MKNSIVTIIALLTELWTGSFWLSCQKLADRFYFSPFDSQLKTGELVHNDAGYSTHIVRFFHNKLSVYGSELFDRYLQFWDIRFGAYFFTIVGYFGILYGFWYLIRKDHKSYKTWTIIIVLLLLPFIEILHVNIPFIARLLILLVPYYIFSLFGIWQFLKKHKKYGVLIISILILLSAWYIFAFEKDILKNFCYN